MTYEEYKAKLYAFLDIEDEIERLDYLEELDRGYSELDGRYTELKTKYKERFMSDGVKVEDKTTEITTTEEVVTDDDITIEDLFTESEEY